MNFGSALISAARHPADNRGRLQMCLLHRHSQFPDVSMFVDYGIVRLCISMFTNVSKSLKVRAILADIEDRLRDWSPAARGTKAPLDGSGATGATSCLCCDQRVRSVRDLQVKTQCAFGCGAPVGQIAAPSFTFVLDRPWASPPSTIA